jgi:acetylornithine deacetylase
MSSATPPTERALLGAADALIAERSSELTEIVQSLIRFDTTSVDLEPGSDHTHNQERALQEYVAGRLTKIGAAIDQFEPDPASLLAHPMMPPWHHWHDRPITVGTIAGAGGGRSLIINGHIDVVAPGDPSTWDSPAFAAELRDGRIYGRGASDMKGGVGAALFALEVLNALGVKLAGDVIFEAVPDEETSAMGTVACIERGYRADGGFVPEPTQLDLWVATRGLLHGSIRVPGRSAHAEMNQPDWREGGGVNAISAAQPVLGALDALSAQWKQRESKKHPLLGTPLVQPTKIHGGNFISNVPESCTVGFNATYLPTDIDENGYGSIPRNEIIDSVNQAVAGSDWLQAHPVQYSWATDYPPSEIPHDHPTVLLAQAAGRDLGLEVTPVGIDTTYDGALLTVLGDTVTPAIGPGDQRRGHAPNEWVGVDELLLGAQVYIRLITGWCGVAGK